MAMERNLEAVAAMVEADWEIASHGYRWIDYKYFGEDLEWEHLQREIAIHTKVTADLPLGWYTGRNSPNTRRLVTEKGGFLSNADDLYSRLQLGRSVFYLFTRCL